MEGLIIMLVNLYKRIQRDKIMLKIVLVENIDKNLIKVW